MITASDFAGIPVFDVLSHAQLSRVAARAADINARTGEYVVQNGDPAYFWAVLDGEVEFVKIVAGELQQVTTFDPSEYFGEVPLMLGTPAAGAVRALRPSRLARIEANDFHAMITECAEAAAIVSQTLIRRVNFMRADYTAANVTQATIVGDRYDFACHDIRDFLSRNQIAFEWLDPGDPGDANCIPAAARASALHPVVVLADGRVLTAPSIRELAQSLHLQIEPHEADYDVAIVGGGPAGLAAAVYGGSEGLRTVMIEREAPGGQAGTSSRIENYLGFPGGVSGGDLANRALLQAKRFGTEIVVTREAQSIETRADGTHLLRLDGGATLSARAIVLATGVAWRELESDGADRFVGRGVYYGAARTEALGTRGKDVFLIGGGNSAGQAAMFFSNYARSVTLLVRGRSLDASMSYYLIEQLRSKTNIFVETQTTVSAVGGGAHVETVVTRNATAETRERPADAVFAFIGADAQTAWLPPQIARDSHGYIVTGHDIADWASARSPFALETSVPGIFAAGDVRSTSVKRVASSVGEGSMAIALIHEYFAATAQTDRRDRAASGVSGTAAVSGAGSVH